MIQREPLNRHLLWQTYLIPDSPPSVVIRDSSLPLVSVVTPSYNQGRFIRETIESVLTQDYPNLEYWVMDGGSKDETLAILRTYESDPRFHWISEQDKGQAQAINKGWSRCQGEILAWLNSDDTYLPGAIRAQVEALQRHPEYGIVYGDVWHIDQNGRRLSILYGRPYEMLELLRFSIPMQPTTFIRREVCESIGPLNERFKYSLDSEYWIRAAKVTHFGYEPQQIATYRLHDGSKTVASHEGFYQEWFAILDAFYADPDRAAQYLIQRPLLYADIYSLIAAQEMRQGSLSTALEYVRKSLQTGQAGMRLLKLLPALIDRYTPFELTPALVEWWSHLQSRQRSRQ